MKNNLHKIKIFTICQCYLLANRIQSEYNKNGTNAYFLVYVIKRFDQKDRF